MISARITETAQPPALGAIRSPAPRQTPRKRVSRNLNEMTHFNSHSSSKCRPAIATCPNALLPDLASNAANDAHLLSQRAHSRPPKAFAALLHIVPHSCPRIAPLRHPRNPAPATPRMARNDDGIACSHASTTRRSSKLSETPPLKERARLAP